MLHPLIRLILLLVFIAASASASAPVLLAGTLLLAVGYALAAQHAIRPLAGLLLRLRWLLLAILLVYGWWTPGDPLFPAAGGLSPAIQGLETGLLRIAALVIIVCAVNLLVRTTPRGQLLAALYSLTGPLLGKTRRQRFAVRVLLTLEAVPRVQTMLAKSLRERVDHGTRLQRLATAVQAVYCAILENASRAAGTVLEFDEPGPPPLPQWLLPPLLAAAAVLLATR